MLLVTALLVPSRGFAHEPRVGPHGGTLVDAGAYPVEITIKRTTVDVYLSDGADKPVPATGFKGTVVLAVDGKSQRIVLVVADTNRLTGQSPIAGSGPPKGAILITGPDGKTAQARLN